MNADQKLKRLLALKKEAAVLCQAAEDFGSLQAEAKQLQQRIEQAIAAHSHPCPSASIRG